MAIYDIIPLELHGMSVWTLFVFVIAGFAIATAIKLFNVWRINHDINMSEQVKRIDAHDQQLNGVAIDIAEIKIDGKHVRQSLEEIKEPLDDMRELNKMVISKVLETDK